MDINDTGSPMCHLATGVFIRIALRQVSTLPHHMPGGSSPFLLSGPAI